VIQLVRLGRRHSVFDNGVRCGALGTSARVCDGAHADGAHNGSLCDGARAVTSAAVSTRSSSPREFFGDPRHLSQYSPPVSRSQGITGTSSAASPANLQRSGSAHGGFPLVDDIRKNGALPGDGAPTGTSAVATTAGAGIEWSSFALDVSDIDLLSGHRLSGDEVRRNGQRVDALLNGEAPGSARDLIGEARSAALRDMSDDPALTRAYYLRHEPTSLHDLLEESDDEMPPEQRKRGMSVKKRRRSRKPGSQRNRDSA